MHVKKGSDVKLIDDGAVDFWTAQGYEPYEVGELVIAPTWAAQTPYTAGQLIWNSGVLYRAKADFTSGSSFVASNWDVAVTLAAVSGTGTPTADPHVAGQLWANAGVVTVSAG